MPRTFKLTIAYDGSDFAGWQVQPNQPTIQGCLQHAVRKITGETVSVIGSGRTDAGVHALAQVASCRLENWNAPAAALGRALNTKLPETIVVHDVEDAADDFHAIACAIGKRYRYQLQIGGIRDAFLYRHWWRLPPHMDIAAMQAAAQRIVGEKDFASFQASGAPRASTIRHVRECQITEQDCNPNSGYCLYALEIEANGFLYNMVRNIVGTIVEVGRGKHDLGWIDDVIAAEDRDIAGPTAPAHALFLRSVAYSGWQSGDNGKEPTTR